MYSKYKIGGVENDGFQKEENSGPNGLHTDSSFHTDKKKNMKFTPKKKDKEIKTSSEKQNRKEQDSPLTINYNLPDRFHLYDDIDDCLEKTPASKSIEELKMPNLDSSEEKSSSLEGEFLVKTLNYEVDIGAADTSTSEYLEEIPINDSSDTSDDDNRESQSSSEKYVRNEKSSDNQFYLQDSGNDDMSSIYEKNKLHLNLNLDSEEQM